MGSLAKLPGAMYLAEAPRSSLAEPRNKMKIEGRTFVISGGYVCVCLYMP